MAISVTGGWLGRRDWLEGASNDAGDTPTPPEADEVGGGVDAIRREWVILKERVTFQIISSSLSNIPKSSRP